MKRPLKFRLYDTLAKEMFYNAMPFSATWNAVICNGGAGMQFTGILDTNNKEIYEDDIVTIISGRGIGIINFYKGAFDVFKKNGYCSNVWL